MYPKASFCCCIIQRTVKGGAFLKKILASLSFSKKMISITCILIFIITILVFFSVYLSRTISPSRIEKACIDMSDIPQASCEVTQHDDLIICNVFEKNGNSNIFLLQKYKILWLFERYKLVDSATLDDNLSNFLTYSNKGILIIFWNHNEEISEIEFNHYLYKNTDGKHYYTIYTKDIIKKQNQVKLYYQKRCVDDLLFNIG